VIHFFMRFLGGSGAGVVAGLPAFLLSASREECGGKWVVGFSESSTTNRITCQSFSDSEAALRAISNKCRLGSIVRYVRFEREAGA
jgi:hypothetical protein